MEEDLADQAVAIANDPSLRVDCKPGRKQNFLVTFFFNNELDNGLSIKISACCLGEAHGMAYFKLWNEALTYVEEDKAITDILIRLGPIISEGKKI